MGSMAGSRVTALTWISLSRNRPRRHRHFVCLISPILIHVVPPFGRGDTVPEGTPISAIPEWTGIAMNRLIYIIGLIVVIVFVMGFLGLR
jgi:hypothetical protein